MSPRIALFLFGCDGPDRLSELLRGVPETAASALAEVVVVHASGSAFDPPSLGPEHPASRVPLRLLALPGEEEHGSARKAAFDYALANQFDHVITMRGDGRHSPSALPALLAPVVAEGAPLVIVSRFGRSGTSRASAGRRTRTSAQTLATGLWNRALGARLRDPFSSLRAYSTALLAASPFRLDADGRLFDAHLLLQCRALGVAPREVEISLDWQEHERPGEGLAHAWRALAVAVGYRLHQLHVIRRGRYFVDLGIHYTLKLSDTSSHMQIVEAIRPGTRVLDLGCSQGLLARPLAERGVRVVGVDAGQTGAHLADELEAYHQRDLELPLELPTGRDFDYAVVADVIEHLRERHQLLYGARRYLRADGRLIASTPNIALWFYRLSLLAGRFEYGPRGVLDYTHVHLYTRDSFRREIERAGYRIVNERVTALPFEVVFESTGRSRLVRALARSYHALARLWPELFAYQIIFEAAITTLDEEGIQGGEPRS